MLNKQYDDDFRLNSRKRLHEEFGNNKEEWNHWLFNHINISNMNSVLEVGCGNGQLWIDNAKKIPNSTHIVLTDLSKGMVDIVNERIDSNNITALEADACNLPFEDNSFDLVLASHMLYHVGDLDIALKEITRVLKKDGVFIASGMGIQNFSEFIDFIEANFLEIGYQEMQNEILQKFNIDDGENRLSSYFSKVDKIYYEDFISVDQEEPLVNYILSLVKKECLSSTYVKHVTKRVETLYKSQNEFRISKEVGILVSK